MTAVDNRLVVEQHGTDGLQSMAMLINQGNFRRTIAGPSVVIDLVLYLTKILVQLDVIVVRFIPSQYRLQM